jgi:hypothetical protein
MRVKGHVVVEKGTSEERGGLLGYLKLLQPVGEMRDGRSDFLDLSALDPGALLLKAFAPICSGGVEWVRGAERRYR